MINTTHANFSAHELRRTPADKISNRLAVEAREGCKLDHLHSTLPRLGLPDHPRARGGNRAAGPTGRDRTGDVPEARGRES